VEPKRRHSNSRSDSRHSPVQEDLYAGRGPDRHGTRHCVSRRSRTSTTRSSNVGCGTADCIRRIRKGYLLHRLLLSTITEATEHDLLLWPTSEQPPPGKLEQANKIVVPFSWPFSFPHAPSLLQASPRLPVRSLAASHHEGDVWFPDLYLDSSLASRAGRPSWDGVGGNSG
jgi:hypothetical protein